MSMHECLQATSGVAHSERETRSSTGHTFNLKIVTNFIETNLLMSDTYSRTIKQLRQMKRKRIRTNVFVCVSFEIHYRIQPIYRPNDNKFK